MTTLNALSHLNAMVEFAQRADTQARALAVTFRNLAQQIDAVLDDVDMPVNETLIERAAGGETRFQLRRLSIQPGSLRIFVNEVESASTSDLATGQITLAVPLAEGDRARAEYTALGLRSQVEPLASAVGITLELVEARRTKYLNAAQWIEENLK